MNDEVLSAGRVALGSRILSTRVRTYTFAAINPPIITATKMPITTAVANASPTASLDRHVPVERHVRMQLPIGVVISRRNQTQITPPARPGLTYGVADDHVGQLQSVAGWQLPDRF